MAYPGTKGSYNLWTPNSDDVEKDNESKPENAAYLQWFKPENGISQNGVRDGHQTRNDERQEEESKEPENDRGNWDNKAEFVLSCIGMSVGLGNVWRFPYLAYEHGGAAFLIAYLVLQLLVGKPLYLMELVMAQYSNLGPTKVWALNPAAKGVGISMCVISLVVAIYYNVIMAYTLFFFFSSMQATLPWTKCRDEWENCIEERTGPAPKPCTDNITYVMNLTACECTKNATLNEMIPYNCTPVFKSSTELYFYKDVIELSDGIAIDQMGAPLWRLSLCLLLSWIIVILCLIKGIKSSGKVVYFTATFPYVILIILLIRGALLDGAKEGVEFFIIPKWEKLLELKVWVAAAGQMFFSLSVSFGGIIMFGSYNKFKNNVYGDALLISAMDLITSVISGFVVFTTFGGMAKTIGTTVDKVAKSGYGLAFVAYPEALSNMPPPQLWSVLFFFMLFTLGLDSEFGLMETILTCIQDEFPKLRKYKASMCIIFGVFCFFLALPCVCPGGDYVVTLMDHYGADFSVLILSCCEVVSVMWVYGVMRFLKDMEYMLGAKPHGWPYWVFCWSFSAPLIVAVGGYLACWADRLTVVILGYSLAKKIRFICQWLKICVDLDYENKKVKGEELLSLIMALLFLYRMIVYSPPQYEPGVPFPLFAQGIGWALLCTVLCPIPIWFVFHSYRTYATYRKSSMTEIITKIFEPTEEWKPADGSDRNAVTDSNYSMDKVGLDNPVMAYGSQDRL